ncbi:MAG: hypothetical protein Q7O66_00745 [Dehalococcoidia bacterium]|nr:hypothetical protein [Dehalococcoidia bacterium]
MSLAQTVRKGAGLTDLNLVVVPHPFDSRPKEEVIEIADRLFGQAMAALTTGALVRVTK